MNNLSNDADVMRLSIPYERKKFITVAFSPSALFQQNEFPCFARYSGLPA
jgi:hypothetical protein